MEYFDSCATKIMMRGPIVYQLCLGRNEKETFYALYSLQIIPRSQFTTLSMYSRHARSLLGVTIV